MVKVAAGWLIEQVWLERTERGAGCRSRQTGVGAHKQRNAWEKKFTTSRDDCSRRFYRFDIRLEREVNIIGLAT